MSDVLPNTGYEIQIYQRGKWVLWCYALDGADMTAKWACMPSLRRTARLMRLPCKTVVEKYEPPQARPTLENSRAQY